MNTEENALMKPHVMDEHSFIPFLKLKKFNGLWFIETVSGR